MQPVPTELFVRGVHEAIRRLGKGSFQALLNQMEHVEMNVKPDVLILSSIFNPIAVEMDKVIVVNPGRLTKGLNGGTFARMTINPLNEDLINEAREDETSNHDGIYNQVYKRAAVQLIRI